MNKIYHSLYTGFSIILFLLAHNAPIAAQDIVFTTDTADLAGVKNFYIDAVSNKIYVAIKGGVAVSTDGGITYTQIIIDPTNQPNVTVNAVYASGNTLYVATNNGFYLSTNSGMSFSNTFTLPNNHASCMFVASDGTLFIGTYAGFSVLPQGMSQFTNYSTKNTTGLGDNHVNSIFVTGGKIYLGTDFGLAISTVTDTSFTNYTTSEGLINNHVNNVFVTSGNVYAATDSGVSVLKNDATFTNYSMADGLGNNYVNDVYLNGSNIFASTDSGMSVLTNGSTRFSTYSTASGLGNLGNYIVYRSLVSGSKVYAITDGGLSQSSTSVTIVSSTGNQNFCLDSRVTFTATPFDGGSSPTFQWKKNNNIVGDNTGIYIDSTLQNNDVINCSMTPSDDAINNIIVTSNSLTMKAIAHPSVSLNVTYYAGTNCINDPSLAANISGTYKSLSWYKDETNVETRNVTSMKVFDGYNGFKIKYKTITTYPDPNYKPTSAGTYFAVVTNDQGCSDISDSLTVLPNTQATIAIGTTSGSSKICTGTPVTFSTRTTDAGNIYTGQFAGFSAIYQWQKNGNNVGTNATSYSDNALQNGDIITCQLQASPLVCPNRQSSGSVEVVSSNSIVMSVSNPPSVSLTANGDCATGTRLEVQGVTASNKISWQLDGVPLFEPNGFIVAGGNNIGTDLNQFIYPQNPFIGSDDTLYIPDFGNHRVLQFPAGSTASTDGVIVAGIDTAGMSLDQLSYPTSVFKDAFNFLFVADGKNNRIIKFPPNSMKATFGVVVAGDTLEGNALNQITPHDVYVDGSGNIYVADGENNRVLKFPPNSAAETSGTIIAGGNGNGNGANQLGTELLFAFDATESYMYVSDAENNRIQKFPTNGNTSTNGITVAGGNGVGAALNQFNFPSTIRMDAAGNLFVGDQNNYRVLVFPPGSTSATTGKIVAGGKGQGNALNQLDTLQGIALDHYGNLIVSDSRNNRILKFNRVGDNPFIPTAKGNYKAVVTDDNYCATTAAEAANVDVPTVSITGSNTICVGSTTTLSPVTGGSWTSSNTVVATVTDAGVVTGVSEGTATFTFTETATGCSSTVIPAVTVKAFPNVSIAGSNAICIGAVTTLSPSTDGSWASSNTAVAMVTDAGEVTGISNGTATFTFTQGGTGCTSAATPAVTVKAMPTVSIIGSNFICIGANTTLSPATGGSWVSSNTAVATVTDAGVVTGVSNGTATFIFTETATGCLSAATPEVTVKTSSPRVSITGSNSICVGTTTTLSPAIGGSWVSSNATVATVTAAGVVTGVSNGTVSFIFTETNTGCTSATTPDVTIKALPTVSIAGSNSICVGTTTTLSPATGGSWASLNAAVATVTNSGVVTGLSNGTATFTFTETSSGCTSAATSAVTIKALPKVSIMGSNSICVGTTTTLSPATGGSWASSKMAVATVTDAGIVKGVMNGTATFSFTETSSGCSSGATPAVTVKALPIVSIVGSNSICVGASTNLSPAIGGSWASSNTTVATVTAAGVVTGVSNGTATFIFSETSTGCTSVATPTVTVKALPIVSIAGLNSICVGATTTLAPATGGIWSSSNTAVATVTTGGVVKGLSNGIATFTFLQTNTSCSSPATPAVTVKAIPTKPSTISDKTYCKGENVKIVPTGSNGTGYNFYDKDPSVSGNGAMLLAANQADYSFTLNVTTPIWITAVSNLCESAPIKTTLTTTICGIDDDFMIADPCICKNNATTLATDGQFDEHIDVTAPIGQTWIVKSITGLYKTTSAAPPILPTPILVGDAFTYDASTGKYILNGIHVDAIGYEITVTNGGFDLSIGNKCHYPNPSFTLAPAFCSNASPVTLVGSAQKGDGTGAAIGTSVFKVDNGSPVTGFDPSAYSPTSHIVRLEFSETKGCTQPIEQSVIINQAPSVSNIIPTIPSCTGGSDGKIDITVTGGAANKIFNWSKIGGGFTASTQNIAGLTAGNYTVIVTNDAVDACATTVSSTVNAGVDVKNPEAHCKPTTIQLDATGKANITLADIDNNSTDNCGITERNLSQMAFDCRHLGTNSVKLTVKDGTGNKDECTTTVTVEDKIKPIITCPLSQNMTLGSFECGRMVVFADPSVSDNCSATFERTDNLTTFNSGSSLTPGLYTIKYRAKDASDNTADCSFKIQINGQLTTGRLTCVPTLTLALDDRQCINVLDAASLLIDNTYYCANYYYASIPGRTDLTFPSHYITSADLGKTLTVTVTDNFSGSCTTRVTVVDTKAPVVNPPQDTIITCADLSRDGKILPSLALPIVIYECGKTTFTYQDRTLTPPIGQTSFNTQPAGFPLDKYFNLSSAYNASKIIVRTYTATDEFNNSSIVHRVIYVKNIQLYQIECPKDVTVACVQGDYHTGIQSTGVPFIRNGGSLQDVSCGIDYFYSDERTEENIGYTIKRLWTLVNRNTQDRQNCEQKITVNDTKPTISCPVNKIVTIDADKKAVILASSIATASDNCTPQNALIWSMTEGGNTNTSFTYTCANLGAKTALLTVKDAAGNASSCTTTIQIVDDSHFCINIPLLAVSGGMNKETGEEVNAMVKISNPTDAMGEMQGTNYQFSNLVQGNSYRVKPERDNDVLNGVTTFDIALISKHILDLQPFTSPYQMIAADVNRDGDIDGADILLIRNLILKRITRFPNNTAWRFIPKNYVFRDNTNPLADDFPELLNFLNLTANVNNGDFVAVKIGDVNLTAKANALALATRTARPFENIYLTDKKLEAHKTYVVDVNINNYNLEALQFALKMDKTKVSSFAISEGNLPQFEKGNFEVIEKDGTVAIAWVNTQKENLTAENTIVQLTITPRHSVWLHELISLDEQFMENLAYANETANTGGEVKKSKEKQLQLKFISSKTDNWVFELHQNRPNPFVNETTISFTLPDTKAAELTIYDVNGKEVYTLNRLFMKGYNEVTLHNAVFKNSGVYFYRLKSDQSIAVKRMQFFK